MSNNLTRHAGNNQVRRFFEEITIVPTVLQSSYYPSLDGLRGIAIILVVMAHLQLPLGTYYDILFNGKLGVLIFFVLSGFLITTLCIKERVINKTISLRNFYIRRALRIFPVAYLYLAVLVILNFVFKLHIHYLNILGAAFYLMDISSVFRQYFFSWHTAHYWSLSVEEQFYLVIPFILKRKFKVYLLSLLSIIFVLPVILFLQSVITVLDSKVLYALTHLLIKFQAIAVGCLFSVLTFKYTVNSLPVKKLKVIFNIIAFALIFFIQYDDLFSLRNMFSGLAISSLIGYLIISNIIPQKDVIYWILNTRVLKVIGVLSYSIYIWQQVFTSNDKNLPGFMINAPTNIICIIVVSCLSYYFYEKFFLRLKIRFSILKEQKLILEHNIG